MAEKEEEESWVATLRQYNSRLNKKDPLPPENLLERGEDTEEDKKLLEECYLKLKGGSGNKYSILPKFYSKVCISLARVTPPDLHDPPD